MLRHLKKATQHNKYCSNKTVCSHSDNLILLQNNNGSIIIIMVPLSYFVRKMLLLTEHGQEGKESCQLRIIPEA